MTAKENQNWIIETLETLQGLFFSFSLRTTDTSQQYVF